MINKNIYDKKIYFFILLFLIFFIIFNSTIFIESIQHDNIRYFEDEYNSSNSIRKTCLADDQFDWVLYLNRPITALIECFTFNFVDSFNDLAIIRIIVILLISISALLLTNILEKYKIPKFPAICLAISAHTLPGFQNYVQMSNLPNVIAIITTFLSFIYLQRNFDISSNLRGYQRNLNYLKSFILLSITLFTYPVFSFIFFVCLLIKYFNVTQVKFNEIFLEFTFFTLVIFLSYFIFKNVDFHYGINWEWVPEHYKANLGITLFINNLVYFFQDKYKHIFNMWFINSNYAWFIFIYTLIILTIINIYRFIKNSTYTNKILIRTSLLIFLATSSFTPILLTNFVQNRTNLGLHISILIILFLLVTAIDLKLKYKNYLTNIIAIILFIIGTVISFINISENSKNNNLELGFIFSKIDQQNITPKRIHLIVSKETPNGFNNKKTFLDEFNIKNSSFPQNIGKIIKLAYQRKNIDIKIFDGVRNDFVVPPDNLILITASKYQDNFCKSKDMLIIDMNELWINDPSIKVYPEGYQPLKQCEFINISTNTIEHDGYHFPSRIFDNSNQPNDFWETKFSKNIEIYFSINNSKNISSYEFQKPSSNAGFDLNDFINRSPKNWSLYGSNNNSEWELIHNIDLNKNFNYMKDDMKFEIDKDTSYEYFKLIIRDISGDEGILRIYELKLSYY